MGLDLVDKPNERGLVGGNFDNIYRVRIEVEWIHKGRINKYRTDFLISSYNFKKITVNQRLNENDLKVNLPNSYFDIYRVVVQFPGTDPGTDPGGGGGGCFEPDVLVLINQNGKFVPKTISTVKVGEFVVSIAESNIVFRKVRKIHKHTGKFEIIQIETNSGYIFRGTSNHPIIIGNKLMKMGSLRKGNKILVFNNQAKLKEEYITKIKREIIEGEVYTLELEDDFLNYQNFLIGDANSNETYIYVHSGYINNDLKNVLLASQNTINFIIFSSIYISIFSSSMELKTPE
ncbi:MAG: Hint domain-containing protein [Candidatus Calescibacterium sp.]|nr:Hint domain-containing protein [Candidatus Calescibacterium sp.]